ncbi:Manganese/iron superoxide dismutase [Fomitopsis serialis]|uniref:Manganese/iron superoxide dismutase n=1 Tax=Fomitopsis serialis TaxID=139415 RepID=UPI0020081E4C|nr:Manganese/iron superoxide dismutase [Neoantrodia serialis]KAH9919540.1 Manganese/iron superoxide dismutase [Neoantrodia serialis]
MELHHKKHHQTYVTALNAAEQAYAKTSSPKERIAPGALKFNGGELAPSAPGQGQRRRPQGRPLKTAILESFGTFDQFKKEFNTATAGIQGSGGAGSREPTNKRLELATTSNQDPLLSLVPVIGVDIWEHAFYLQYLNAEKRYLEAMAAPSSKCCT